MKNPYRILIAVFALSLGAGSAIAHQEPAAAIGMVTGPKTGTYIAFGRDIALVAKNDGLVINVYDSKGSIDNIERIASKEKAGLAIVQSDVLGFLIRSKNADSLAIAKKLRVVAPLYSEEVHILAHNDIKTLADLAGKRVVVGNQGSGSMITAVNIFSTLGISPSKLYEIDPPRGVVAVLNNEADALVFVGGKPVKMFKNMEALAGITQGPNAGKLAAVHFLPLSDARLLKEYKPATLTGGDYNYVAAEVPTVAVTALLVTYDYTLKDEPYYHMQCRNIAKLAEILRDNLAFLKENGHPKWKEVDLNGPIGPWKRDACSQSAMTSAPAPASGGHGLEQDLIGVIRGN